MSDGNQTKSWKHWDEAKARIRANKDPLARRVLHQVMLPIYTMVLRQESPPSDFDCEFFVKIVEDAFREPEKLRKLLNGELPDLFENEEEEQAWIKDLLES